MRLIDADFLKEWVDEYLSIFKKYDKGTIKGFVDHAPTIEPKRGEWLDYEIPLEDGGSMPIQVCNLCKTFYPLAYTGGGHHFCPNCGADMRKESE